MAKRIGVHLFANAATRRAWVDTKGVGLSINGCTYRHSDHSYTDTFGNVLYLVVASSADRMRGVKLDKVENIGPIDSEEMYVAWETLKAMVRPRPPVIPSGQEGHDDGQELDRQRNQAPGGATLATGSAAGADDPQEQAEGGDRRGGRAVGTEAGKPGEDTGGIQPEVAPACCLCGGTLIRYAMEALPDDGDPYISWACPKCDGEPQ